MIEALFDLNRASSQKVKGNKAPHKPVLFLALIQEVEEDSTERLNPNESRKVLCEAYYPE
jgi:hypothetical protein